MWKVQGHFNLFAFTHLSSNNHLKDTGLEKGFLQKNAFVHICFDTIINNKKIQNKIATFVKKVHSIIILKSVKNFLSFFLNFFTVLHTLLSLMTTKLHRPDLSCIHLNLKMEGMKKKKISFVKKIWWLCLLNSKVCSLGFLLGSIQHYRDEGFLCTWTWNRWFPSRLLSQQPKAKLQQ